MSGPLFAEDVNLFRVWSRLLKLCWIIRQHLRRSLLLSLLPLVPSVMPQHVPKSRRLLTENTTLCNQVRHATVLPLPLASISTFFAFTILLLLVRSLIHPAPLQWTKFYVSRYEQPISATFHAVHIFHQSIQSYKNIASIYLSTCLTLFIWEVVLKCCSVVAADKWYYSHGKAGRRKDRRTHKQHEAESSRWQAALAPAFDIQAWLRRIQFSLDLERASESWEELWIGHRIRIWSKERRKQNASIRSPKFLKITSSFCEYLISHHLPPVTS